MSIEAAVLGVLNASLFIDQLGEERVMVEGADHEGWRGVLH